MLLGKRHPPVYMVVVEVGGDRFKATQLHVARRFSSGPAEPSRGTGNIIILPVIIGFLVAVLIALCAITVTGHQVSDVGICHWQTLVLYICCIHMCQVCVCVCVCVFTCLLPCLWLGLGELYQQKIILILVKKLKIQFGCFEQTVYYCWQSFPYFRYFTPSPAWD